MPMPAQNINDGCRTAVVVLNWNGRKLLEEFLPAVVENTPSSIADVVVADNASSDDSIEYLKKCFPSVKTVVLDSNYGFAGGYNRVLAQLDYEYCVLLNSDAAPAPGWLEPLIGFMDLHPDAACCVPKIKDYRNKERFEYAGAGGGFIDKFGYPFCRGRIMDNLEVDKGQYNSVLSLFWGSGAALMVRTKLYNQSGGLDNDFFAHMEEIDLCWRLKNRGYNIYQIPQSEVYHLGGGTLSQHNERKTYLNFRNNLFMIIKNDYSKFWWFKLFMRMVLDGVAALHFLAKREFHFFGAVVKAHLHFHANAPAYYKKRRALKPLAIVLHHPEIFPRSIVWSYFIRKRRTFNQLKYYKN